MSDETVPEHMQKDGYLWSGCLSGAFREDLFLQAFADAGFHGIEIAKRQPEPWQTIEGIEFRSMTVVAWKGKQGPCLERNQALLYKGPFRQVEDDDGHVFVRGQRMAVCDKTFQLFQKPPYEGVFEPIEPLQNIPLEEAEAFDCRRQKVRDPRETKGAEYDLTTEASSTIAAIPISRVADQVAITLRVCLRRVFTDDGHRVRRHVDLRLTYFKEEINMSVLTLLREGNPLADVGRQREILETAGMPPCRSSRLAQHGIAELRRDNLETLQINVGKLCNQTCRHCHVDAGPDRRELMTKENFEHCLRTDRRIGR